MSERRIKSKISKLMVTIVLLLLLVPLGCVDSEKSYIYHITRVNPDGTVENWIVRGSLTYSEGFIKWTDKNGGTKSVSGAITVKPVAVEKPKPESKES